VEAPAAAAPKARKSEYELYTFNTWLFGVRLEPRTPASAVRRACPQATRASRPRAPRAAHARRRRRPPPRGSRPPARLPAAPRRPTPPPSCNTALLQEERRGTLDTELATVLSSISVACKQIAAAVGRAGISSLTGVAGTGENVQVRGGARACAARARMCVCVCVGWVGKQGCPLQGTPGARTRPSPISACQICRRLPRSARHAALFPGLRTGRPPSHHLTRRDSAAPHLVRSELTS
jgi:hypothetical protein